jgi:branched-chain amino acid transport system substrate-binding protein
MRALPSRVVVGVVALSCGMLGLAACGDDSASGASSDEIVIGEIITTSGQYGATGELVQQGVDLAVDEINADGGVDGKKIVIKKADDAGDKATAIAQFRKFATDKSVMAIIGPNLSISAIATTPLANQFKVVSLTPTAQGEWPVDFGDWFFRLPPTNEVQNQSLVDQVSQAYDFKKVAIVHADDQDVAVSDAENFEKMLPAAGYDVVADLSFKSTDSDYSAMLTSLKNSGAEAAFFSAIATQAGPVLNQAAKLGVDLQWVGTTSLPLPDTIKLGGAGAEGLIAPTTYYPDQNPAAQAYAKAFQAKYGQDSSTNAASSYDAINLLAQAIEGIDGDVTRDAIREQLGQIHFSGVTGTVSFPDGSGNSKRGAISLVQVKDGKFVQWQAP